MKKRCPTCGHALREGGRITERELDVLAAWWLTGSVTKAAEHAGVGQQRAKNLLHHARIRNHVASNEDLLELHFVAVRSLVAERTQHNASRSEAA